MRITIEIPDNAVKMFVDLVDALRTIAKTVEVETKNDGTVDAVIQEAEQLKKEKVKRNLDAFQKLAEEQKAAERTTKPAYTLEQVRAKLADLTRKGKRAEVKALIQSFGASKLSEVPVEKYAELMAKAEEIQ